MAEDELEKLKFDASGNLPPPPPDDKDPIIEEGGEPRGSKNERLQKILKAEQSTIADFRQTDILTAKLDTHDLVFSSIKRGFSGLEQQIPRNATGMTHSRLERTQELVGVLKMADGLKAEMSDVAKKLYSSDELSENLVKKAGEVKGRLKAFEKKLEQFTENTSKFVIRIGRAS